MFLLLNLNKANFSKIWIRETIGLFNDFARPHQGWCKKEKVWISRSLDCSKMMFQKSSYMSYFIVKLKDILREACVKLLSDYLLRIREKSVYFLGYLLRIREKSVTIPNPWRIHEKIQDLGKLLVNLGELATMWVTRSSKYEKCQNK